MATYTKFYPFMDGVVAGTFANLATDTLQVALCPAANTPVVTNTQLSNLTQIAYTNLSSQVITTTSFAATNGVYKLLLADLTLTASGDVAAFQFVVVFDQTVANDLLIAWFDYGSAVTLHNGETFVIDFDGTNGLFLLG
jgi:hypothetical protein